MFPRNLSAIPKDVFQRALNMLKYASLVGRCIDVLVGIEQILLRKILTEFRKPHDTHDEENNQ